MYIQLISILFLPTKYTAFIGVINMHYLTFFLKKKDILKFKVNRCHLNMFVTCAMTDRGSRIYFAVGMLVPLTEMSITITMRVTGTCRFWRFGCGY